MNNRKEIIFILEDRKALSDIFSQHGYEVITVNDTKKALEKIYTKTPHIIVIDVSLPIKESSKLCRIIKSDIVLNRIPIVVITEGHNSLENKIEGREFDSLCCLSKSFKPGELIAEVKTLLEHSYYELDANPLTNFPGNSSSLTAIEKCIKEGKWFVVCYMDLDKFKVFNDVYGFDRGDQVIKFTAAMITKAFDELDIKNGFVGHLGGDDFVFITEPEKAEEVCSYIIKLFDKGIMNFYNKEDRLNGYIQRKTIEENKEQYYIMTASIVGVHNKKRKIEHLGKVSKIAEELKLYIKKSDGSNYIFDRRTDEKKPVEQKVDRRNVDVLELKELIRDRKVRMVFQPIVLLKSQEIIGYEALLRGPKDTQFENPEKLFSIAERGDLVLELDRLCIEEALRCLNVLSKKHYLFVNIKGNTLGDLGLLKNVFRIKELAAHDNAIVNIEISEKDIYSPADKFEEGIEYLKSVGVRIGIDDVGSGVVSLRDITKFRPDFLKIDISLIRHIHHDPVRQNILYSLLNFSRFLKVETIAEGIETEKECEYLKNNKVSYGQGYLFSRPISFDEVKKR